MPTFLSDPSDTFYVLLFVMALIAIVVWLRSRDKKSQFGAIAGVILFALFIICDQAFDSPREESMKRVEDMVAALNERNADLLRAHVSDSFEYKGKQKSDVKQFVELAKQHNVRVAVWDFDRERVVEVSDNEIDIVFNGKAVFPDGKEIPSHFKTKFVKEKDGQWRLKTFARYDIMKKEQGGEEPMLGF